MNKTDKILVAFGLSTVAEISFFALLYFSGEACSGCGLLFAPLFFVGPVLVIITSILHKIPALHRFPYLYILSIVVALALVGIAGWMSTEL